MEHQSMRNLTHKHKKDWITIMEEKTSTPDYIIQQWLQRLDQTAVEYEARWGADALPKLVSESTRIKWETQSDRMDAAIQASDPVLFRELVEGTIRGYKALEAEAIKAGFKPHGAPVAWTVRLPSGGELAICATHADAGVLQGTQKFVGTEYLIWSLEEIANLVDLHGRLKPVEPMPKKRERLSFEDDVIPFS